MKAVLVALAVLVLAGCTPEPNAVSERPSLPSCSPDEAIFLPPGQGVGAVDDPDAALLAIRCLESAWKLGEARELDFTLMGVEGQGYRAIVQVFDDSTVDYLREWDEGWEIYVGCSGIAFPQPGVPDPINCESITLP